MQKLLTPLLVLLCSSLSESQANRVYVHPFVLFAANVSCVTDPTQTEKPLEMLPVASLSTEDLTPDSRDPVKQTPQKQSVTEKMVVLANLLNSVGLRMYQAVSSKQRSTNTLLSPVSTYGSLVTLSFGASKNTTNSFQVLAFDLFSVKK